MNIVYSAPLQVILSGNEGMTYGKPAIASAIQERIFVAVRDGEALREAEIDEVVKKHLKVEKTKEYSVKVSSEHQEEVLGHKHAVIAATVAALLELYSGKEAQKEVVNKLAFQVAKRKDRSAAGLRVSTSVFGGLTYYRKEFEFLKSVYALPFQIPKDIEDDLYINLSKKSDVASRIEKMYKKDSDKAEKYLINLEKVTKRMVVAIVKEDRDFFLAQISELSYPDLLYGVINSKIKTLKFVQSSQGLQRE